MGKKDKKKSKDEEAKFVIRIEKALRDEFVDVCRDLDTTASREVRRFIREFLARQEASVVAVDTLVEAEPVAEAESVVEAPVLDIAAKVVEEPVQPVADTADGEAPGNATPS